MPSGHQQLDDRHGLLEGFLSRQRGKMAGRLIPRANRTGRVLDVGCGAYPRFLMSIDFSEKYGLDRLGTSSGHDPVRGITHLEWDIETSDTLPFDNEFFDVVTMLAVFEHIEPARLVSMVVEIRRLLKPGGLYILTTPAAWTDGLLRLLASWKVVGPAQIAEHKDTYGPAKISAILQRGGFSGEQIRCGYFELFMNVWATARK